MCELAEKNRGGSYQRTMAALVQGECTREKDVVTT